MDQLCATLQQWTEAAVRVRDAQSQAVKATNDAKRKQEEAEAALAHAETCCHDAEATKQQAAKVLKDATARAERLIEEATQKGQHLVTKAKSEAENLDRQVTLAKVTLGEIKQRIAEAEEAHTSVQHDLTQARTTVQKILAH
jgi:chromosome segregation ATPase